MSPFGTCCQKEFPVRYTEWHKINKLHCGNRLECEYFPDVLVTVIQHAIHWQRLCNSFMICVEKV